jgi:Transposase
LPSCRKRRPDPSRSYAAATASVAATYYKWKQKFGGLEVKDAQRLRLLEEENRKLKKLVADQALDNMVLKELLGKKS